MEINLMPAEQSFSLFTRPSKILIAITGFLVLATVLQDLIRAVTGHSGFYLSESLLFGSFWWIFIPLGWMQYFYNNQAGRINNPRKVLLMFAPAVLHLFAFPVLVWALSGIFYYHTFAIRQTLQYTLSEHLYQLLLLYPVSFMLYGSALNKIPAKQDLQPVVPEPAKKPVSSLIVTEGNRRIQLSTAEILYLTANTPYINIHLGHKKYMLADTLKSVSEKLDGHHFIRIHKSAIVNTQHIKFYTSRFNGDYDLTMVNNEKLRLSRNYVADFKMKWSGSPQLNRD